MDKFLSDNRFVERKSLAWLDKLERAAVVVKACSELNKTIGVTLRKE